MNPSDQEGFVDTEPSDFECTAPTVTNNENTLESAPSGDFDQLALEEPPPPENEKRCNGVVVTQIHYTRPDAETIIIECSDEELIEVEKAVVMRMSAVIKTKMGKPLTSVLPSLFI